MLRSGNKTVAGFIGAGLILAAAWMGFDISGDDSADTPTPTSMPTTANTFLPGQNTSTPAPEPTTASPGQNTISGLPTCTTLELPNQADLVIGDILAGGPFDYPDNDGVRFGNYEGILPDESNNYYREYTVETPGLNHRGPLRIVTGGTQATDPEVWYFTEDHYESFCEITDAESVEN
ncbi:guanyl-specific ribonuclease [Corynebacterium faecale]|uniref:ribonuclease domain-containing protein n=1 Tax=Corynebacterium faecale TaxID=1758466 RepID=UPI0025B4025C|nr:ribonuclease domain-containing protein [Corynebacterium faecale]